MKSLNTQTGVVLVFSLVILVLTTLVGVNMVQQNRLQFMMAVNSQMQANNFANVEDILRITEDYIASQRYTVWPHIAYVSPVTESDPPDFPDSRYTCSKDTTASPETFNQMKPTPHADGTLTASLGLATGIAAQTTVEIVKTACMTFFLFEKEEECVTDTSGWVVPTGEESYCNQSDQQKCSTEIYTVKVSITDPDNGGKQIIESRFAIRCDI